MRSTSKRVLEVEQKFALDDDGSSRVETRLVELGFSKTNEIDMVDWYFDTPDWSLTPRDCWLRCRETPRGSSWQLKRGKKHEGGATVYEELEDEEAIEASISLLPNSISHVMVPEEYEGHAVPKIPQPTPARLVPFARIETNRQSWTFDGDSSEAYDGLSIDLDGTQYGYMVGEVEAVVYNDSDVSLAKTRIDALVKEITRDQDASNHVPVGKLEHYLIRHRPDHYKACVRRR